MLKRGDIHATKHGRDQHKRPVTFKLDEEESSLSWEGTTRAHEVLRAAGKVLRAAERRCLPLEHLMEIHVGRPEDARPDHLELHRTQAAFLPSAHVAAPATDAGDDHLLLTLLLQ